MVSLKYALIAIIIGTVVSVVGVFGLGTSMGCVLAAIVFGSVVGIVCYGIVYKIRGEDGAETTAQLSLVVGFIGGLVLTVWAGVCP